MLHSCKRINCCCRLQFLRLGFDGYKKIMQNLMEVAAHLAKGLLDTGNCLLASNVTVPDMCCMTANVVSTLISWASFDPFAGPALIHLLGLR